MAKLKKKRKAETKSAKPQSVKKAVSKGFKKGNVEVNLYSIKGKAVKKIRLPQAFDEPLRLDLIRKVIHAYHSNKRQPYGPNPMAGMRHAVSTWGKGRGVARVQRFSQGRTAAESPGNVGGRRAHPPKVEKNWSKKVNRKEKLKARNSALSALAAQNIVIERGHKFDKKITVPLVLENDFEDLQETKKVIEVLEKLGVYNDVIRATNGKHIRAGRGKSRGRKYKIPKSLLIIVTDPDKIKRSVGNLLGIDVVTPQQLNVEHLAPGGDPGRLTIFTERAMQQIGGW
ncbi:MAG: 50S ribosomal protein L4 [Thermoplasmata archaeon]|nr:50S ribosomal protein L4 [Thermoplasmata archaeon]